MRSRWVVNGDLPSSPLERDYVENDGKSCPDVNTRCRSGRVWDLRPWVLTRRGRAPIADQAHPAEPPLAIHGLEIDPARRALKVRGEAVEVTRQEFHLLHLLASNPGIVFTRERLLSKVWQGQAFVTGRSVDTLVKRLRRKIEADPASPRLIITVWGDGYKFLDG